jgi:hypothetical protein
MSQVTVYSGSGRARSWTLDEKRAFVSAAFAPGVCVVEFARRADIAASILYRWRQKFAVMDGGNADDGSAALPDFVPLMISREPVAGGAAHSMPPTPTSGLGSRLFPEQAALPHTPALTMTARGVSVEMAHDISPTLVTAVLAALVT